MYIQGFKDFGWLLRVSKSVGVEGFKLVWFVCLSPRALGSWGFRFRFTFSVFRGLGFRVHDVSPFSSQMVVRTIYMRMCRMPLRSIWRMPHKHVR